MIDLYFISFSWVYILVFFIGAILGMFAIGLVSGASRADMESEIARKNKRIETQTQMIFEMRKHLVEAKGAASSNELRADCLERLKNELQKEYDDLHDNYKKLYVQLDALKASEVKKFPAPQEISEDLTEILTELTTIEEMLTSTKIKVSLAG